MGNHSHDTFKARAPRKSQVLQLSGASLTVGTRILTQKGETCVEDLKPGNMVVTKDFGAQKLRYIAFQDVDLRKKPDLAPIRVTNPKRPGVLVGHFAPSQRLALRHPMFKAMFNGREVLVECGDLVELPGIQTVQNLKSITYVALGFARHQLVFCNQAVIEIGTRNQEASRVSLGPEEARLAWNMVHPAPQSRKRQGFPLH